MWPIKAQWLRPATPPVGAVSPGPAAWSCDLYDQTLRWDDGVYDLFGIDRGVHVDRRETVGFYDDESRVAMERLRGAAIASGAGFTLDARIVGANGVRRWMRLDAQMAWHKGRRFLHGTKRDVTADRATFEALRRQETHDPLTGLMNRHAFERGWTGEMATVIDVAVAAVNRRHGRAAGDACLIAVATRLRAACPDAALIARIDGARFAMVGDRAVGAGLSLPIVWDARLVHFGVSVTACHAHPSRCARPPHEAGEVANAYRSLR